MSSVEYIVSGESVVFGQVDQKQTKKVNSAPVLPLHKTKLHFDKKYKLLDTIIGYGHSSKVKKCIRRKDTVTFACKIISKRNMTSKQLQKYT